MTESKKFKDRAIFALFIVIVVMAVAVIVLAQNNLTKINGTANGDGLMWDVKFLGVKEVDRVGNALEKYPPEYDVTYIYFDVDFQNPGDSITYEVRLANNGKLDAVLTNINRIETANIDAIKYYVTGLNENEVIKAGEEKAIQIKVVYESSDNVTSDINKGISLSFDFAQAN